MAPSELDLACKLFFLTVSDREIYFPKALRACLFSVVIIQKKVWKGVKLARCGQTVRQPCIRSDLCVSYAGQCAMKCSSLSRPVGSDLLFLRSSFFLSNVF